MPRTSAGLLLYRVRDGALQVLLVHPGGPYYARKDAGSWSIPKGEPAAGEDALEAARREAEEETSLRPDGPFVALPPIVQKGGKRVHAWASPSPGEPAAPSRSTFLLEWPPRSGQRQEFPEADRAEFFDLPEGRRRILASQIPLLDELERAWRAGLLTA